MPLPRSFYLNRLKKIRSYLQERGQSAYLIFNVENFKYLSGFLTVVGHQVERPLVLVCPLNDDPLIVQCEINKPYYDFDLQSDRCWINDARYYLEHPRLTGRMETVYQFHEVVAKVLKEKGIERGSVAVDTSVNRRLQEALPDARFVDESGLLTEMRLIKTDEELTLMRNGGAISDVGQKVFLEELKVGSYECEVGTEATRTAYVEAAKRYPESLAAVRAMLMTSPFGMTSPPRSRKLEAGDVVTNIVSVTLDGYMIENERTFVIGEANERQRKVFNVMVEAQRKGLEACVVGNRICDIDSATQKVVEEAGLAEYIAHRTGHGQGLSSHEYPYDMAFNTRPLKPGMVFSCEPGIYIPGFASFRHSDNMIVTEGQPDVISKFPKDLESLTAK